jgi:hypothetical protein
VIAAQLAATLVETAAAVATVVQAVAARAEAAQQAVAILAADTQVLLPRAVADVDLVAVVLPTAAVAKVAVATMAS